MGAVLMMAVLVRGAIPLSRTPAAASVQG
jgi:hypothetical protein